MDYPSQGVPLSAGNPPRRYLVPLGLAVLLLLVVSAGFLLGGEPAKFMEIGLQFVPLAILALLAYGGVKNTTAAVFTYVWLAIVALAVLFNSFASVLIVYMNVDQSLLNGATRPNLSDLFKPGAGPAILSTTLLLFVMTLVALVMFLRPVRVLMSRIIPIDPDNFVHKIALFILTLILLSSFVPLIVLGGRPPLLEAVTNGTLQNLGEDSGLSIRPIDLIYQFVWTIPVTFVAAGWPVARTFRAMLVRLGMVRPTLQQVLAAIALGLVLAFLSGFLDQGIQQLWTAMGWPTTNAQAFEQLLGKVITPLGAVLIGVTAGVGEEMAVRGLLQPRIGLIASNLVFTSLHAFQYGLDALLSVFIIGLVLGIIRARSNTTTSAITHGVYDFTLVFVSAVAGSAGP
jgi:membrane protease YdiL (CAAX protease family)